MSNPFEFQPSESIRSTEKPENNFFQDAYDFCTKHPLETLGAAIGIAGGAALTIRNPFVLRGLSRTGMLSKLEALETAAATLSRKVFGAPRVLTAAERMHFQPKLDWVKGVDGTATAKWGEIGNATKYADGTMKLRVGSSTSTYLNDGRHIQESLNGYKQTRNIESVETVFSDGRKLTMPSTGGGLRFQHPDGTDFTLSNHGSIMSVRKPDGTFIHQQADGHKSISWANENSFRINADGARELYLDKKLYWVKPGQTDWRRLSDQAPPVDDQVKKALEPWLTADPISEELAKVLAKLFHA